MPSYTSSCLNGMMPTSRNGSVSARATAHTCSNWRSANMRSEDSAAKLRRLRDTYEPVPDAQPDALLGGELQIDDERRAPPKDEPPPPPTFVPTPWKWIDPKDVSP